MPAPVRPKPWTLHPYPIECPKGIVGVYSDKEVDALLQGAGIIPLDLAAYDTAVQTDAKLAELRAWVAEQITAAVTGGSIDLSAYATTTALTEAVQNLTAQIVSRYTKDEIDAMLLAAEGNWTQLVQALDTQWLAALTSVLTQVGAQIDDRPTLATVEAMLAALPPASSAPVVHASPLPSPAAPTPQGIIDAYAGEPDGLHYYAQSATLVVLQRSPLPGGRTQATLLMLAPAQTVLARVSNYTPMPGQTEWPTHWVETQAGGSFTRVEAPLPSDQFAPASMANVYQFATQADVAAAIAGVQAGTLSQEQIQAIVDAATANGGTVDLSPYAKRDDAGQAITAKTVTAQGLKAPIVAFDDLRGLTIKDTGEGYGERLYFFTGLTVDAVVLKSDLDPLFPRMKALDERLAAVSPRGATSINDPAFADLRTSILNEVKRMLVGGAKYPPPDLDWTNCRNAATTADITAVQARMIGGMIEFKGVLSFASTASSTSLLTLPSTFPLPELAASYPVAARLVGVNAVYAYATVNSTTRSIGVTQAGSINEVTFSGLRFRAAS